MKKLRRIFPVGKTAGILSVTVLLAIVTVFACEGVRSENARPDRAVNDVNSLQISALKNKPDSKIVEKICNLICTGEIDAAEEIFNNSESNIPELASIIEEYNRIERQRKQRRQEAYQQQLEELYKFNHPSEVNDPNYVKNLEDVNDILDVFSVAAKAVRLATSEQQKTRVLSNPIVKETIKKAKQKAEEYESKGQWLDSYINCYSWLETIAPDNEEYSDYADRLLKKANIVGSFKDSPCETREERFENIEPEMFERAIDVLNFNYVKTIDYNKLAVSVIDRCKLLADVIKDSNVVSESLYGEEEIDFSNKFSGWYSGLDSIKQDLEKSFLGVTKDKFISTFEEILALNRETAEIPESPLVAQIADAALEQLDPYTRMIWPKNVEDFEKVMTNEFSGIGIEITNEKGMPTVKSLLPGTPAYKSGLDAGDVITKVDGIPTRDMSLDCVVKNITGPEGTDVELTIRHKNEKETHNITITRATITVPTIRGWKRTEKGQWKYFIDTEDKIGLIRLTSFSENSAKEFEKVLNKLEAQGLQGLILDLRFNSGGLLEVAADIADMFLEEGLIVSTRPRFGVLTYLSAEKKGTHPNYPLVVLTNEYSASASEIVAGALADKKHERAVLVGGRTHGKGSVQGITRHPGNGAKLKYTMAYYHLPSGQRVESRDIVKEQGRSDWGVGPDVKVELTDDETQDMMDVRRANDVLVKEDHEDEKNPVEKYPLQEVFEKDPQLAIGKLIVEAQLYEKSISEQN